MNVPSRLARIYNAAVTHLRHHLPMVAYALGGADGDAALVQLVHVEAEKRAVDIMRDFMDERQLGGTVRRAGGVAGRIEERYTSSSGDGEGLFGGMDETNLAGIMGLGQGGTGESDVVLGAETRGVDLWTGSTSGIRLPTELTSSSFSRRHRVEARPSPAGRLRLRVRGREPRRRRREPRGVGPRDAVHRVVRAVHPARRGGGLQGPPAAKGAEEGGEEKARGGRRGEGAGRRRRYGGRLGEERLEGGERGRRGRRPG